VRILVAFDDSACSDAALADLATAGLPNDADVDVVSVAETWLPAPFEELAGARTASGQSANVERPTDAAARARRRLVHMFPRWDPRTAVLRGSPASEILAYADAFDPDLMVVGSHDRSALGRFALGSVSERLVARAECSVRVARGRALERTHGQLLVGLDDSASALAAVGEVAQRHWPDGTEVLLLTVYDPTLSAWPERDRELRRIYETQRAAATHMLRRGIG
jgi:nucleotide-binding universal stress UspA family protein